MERALQFRQGMRVTMLIAVAAGCAGAAKVPPRPMGVQDHLAEAERHEEDARTLEQRAADRERSGTSVPAYTCGDQALADQVTSGGERLGARAPCWRGERGAVERDRAAAARLRDDARAHRARARAMVAAERIWCGRLPPEELEHSPFDHREDLAAVQAELERDRVVGARIRFARVPHLTADWLRQALACHQAIAESAGHEPTLFGTCPAVVAGASTTVIDDPAGIVVVIRAADPGAALAVYARAEALLDHTDPHAGH